MIKKTEKTLRDYLYFFIFAWLTIASVLICGLSIIYLAYICRKCLFWRLAKNKGGLISKSIINLIVKMMSLIFFLFSTKLKNWEGAMISHFLWSCNQIENMFRELATLNETEKMSLEKSNKIWWCLFAKGDK